MTKSAVGTKVQSAGKPSGRVQRAAVSPAGQPSGIRNVAVVGHSGVGKTTLVEHLLVRAGAINRPGSVGEGTTVSDSDSIEVSQQRSVFLSVCAVMWREVLINLLDTPGFGEHVPELRAGLRAADAVLFVISAAEPMDETTLGLWEECAALNIPRAVVITRLGLISTPRSMRPASHSDL